jgi:hypothetical protein
MLKYEFDRIDQKINLEKFNYRKIWIDWKCQLVRRSTVQNGKTVNWSVKFYIKKISIFFIFYIVLRRQKICFMGSKFGLHKQIFFIQLGNFEQFFPKLIEKSSPFDTILKVRHKLKEKTQSSQKSVTFYYIQNWY